MSRLTGSDALGLFEAYQAVYAPQELTEEQVWEGVEEWVNSLLEEGYDLSDYTWEEMYEAYLRESSHLKEFFGPGMEDTRKGSPKRATQQRLDMGVVKGGGRSGYTISTTDKPKSGESTSQWQTRRTQALALANKLNKETGLGKNKKTTSLSNIPTGTKNSPYTEKNLGASQYKAYKDGGGDAAFSKGSGTAAEIIARGRKAASAATAATTTPARTSGGTPAKPAATPPASTKPKAANTPPASTSTPTPRPKDTSITDMIGRSQVRQGAAINTGNTSSDARAMAARSSVGTATASPSSTAAKPSPAAPSLQQSIRNRRLNMSFDLFDVVMGHLLDEGYADTEESALAIMANMSEEWRESIVEERAPGVKPYTPNRLKTLPPAKPLSGERGDGSGYGGVDTMKDWKLNATPSTKDRKGRTISQRMNDENPYKNRMMGELGRRSSRIGAEVDRVIRGRGEPRATVSLAQKDIPAPTEKKEKKKPSREIVRRNKDTNESYNIILSYLLDEGYANSVEAAESIMVSMSEDWVLSIIG